MNEQTYPNDEYISGGELYKFLHISKRKMKYLLEHGYIKHIDTGKKTHRFMVKLSDAEEFKVRLETDAELTGFPSQSIYRLCEQKKIFSAKVSDMIFCGKESVISYFGSVERIARPFATEGYTKLIKDFVRKEAKRK